MNEFFFTGSYVHTLNKGELIVIGLNSVKSSNLNYYTTAVFEWDTHS